MKPYRKVCTEVTFANGRPVLNIFARDMFNQRQCVKVKDLPCYFYIKENEHIEDEDRKLFILRENYGFKSLFGEDLKKIYVKKISDIRKLGNQYTSFESDLKWDKKCLLDLKITDMFVEDDSKVWTLDHRFNALKEQINVSSKDDSVSSSVVINDLKGKSATDRAFKYLKDGEDNVPTIGHKQFELRECVFDIEVIVDKREDLSTCNGKIVCVVMWDSYTGEYHKFKLINSEKNLILQVLNKFKDLDFDLITGWNVNFDMKWIIKRAEFFDLDLSLYFKGGKTWINAYRDFKGDFIENIHVGGRVLIDSMELYKKKTMTTEKLQSYSLKYVALIEGFEQWEDLGAEIKKYWDDRSDEIVEYCRLDVERTMQIIKKKALLSGALTTCKFFGCAFDEVSINSKVIDSMMFLLKGNKILPNIRRSAEKGKVKGAKVLDTIAGMHHNVGIFDAASLYPSIIGGLNISPECLKPAGLAEHENTDKYVSIVVNGVKHYLYKKNFKIGLISETIMEMRKLREDIRRNRQEAVSKGDKEAYDLYNNEEKVAKGVLASVYGVMAFNHFRLFNEDCANIITSVGRGMIDQIKETLETDEYKVLYGDTDSVFIKCKDLEAGVRAKSIINDLMINYIQKFDADEKVIEVNFEKFFKWILFIKKISTKTKSKIYKKSTAAAKKNYIGFISHKEAVGGDMKEVSEMYYRGISLRRSDSAKVLKDVMQMFFKLMEDGDYKKSIAYLKTIKDEFKTYDMDYIAMPRSINNEDANNPWANGLRYSKDILNFVFNDDTMPKLIYVKNQYKYRKTNVLCYQDGHNIPKEFELDYDVMFNKLIRAKFEPILESLGLFWSTYIEDQVTLDTWA